MNWLKKNGLTAMFLAAAAVLIVGCHTLEGAGRDVEAIGAGVAETADDTRAYEAQPPRRR